MLEEWKEHEVPSSPSRLFSWESFEEFLQNINIDREIGRLPWVPASLFFLIEDQKILWAISIWYHTNHPNLIEWWSHISYGIRPNERWKWYAKEMLRLGLIEAKKIWINIICITCDDDNIASAKVIEANGWIFERFSEKDGKKWRRYWIELFRDEKELLRSLEIELLQYDTRHDPDRINVLLADDFFECGHLGHQFGKKECLNALPNENPGKTLEHSDMTVHMLSEKLGQVRFLCKIEKPWEPATTSYRNSLWRKTPNWWQMFFHQGTLIQTKN
jgi:predicted acetyltransferase